MSFISYAKKELERAGLFSEKGNFYGGLTGKAVMELCEVFDKQEHSGASAPLVASLFKQLVESKPLSPLTGEDDEWIDNSNDHYQNNRCPNVFKEKKTGKAYQMDYYIFIDENGSSYISNNSRKYIEFPYTPTHEFITKRKNKYNKIYKNIKLFLIEKIKIFKIIKNKLINNIK